VFEKYTEKARRVIFLARYEASQFGGPVIETEHLLLGLLREDKALASEFLPLNALGAIRKQIEASTVKREKVSTSVDMPLSSESKRVLAYAAEEAERLKHHHIGTRHLLLGLLREEQCFAASILRERGMSLSQAREKVSATWDAASDVDQRATLLLLNQTAGYLRSYQKTTNVTVLIEPRVLVYTPDIGIYVGEVADSVDSADSIRPLICLEILSPEDRFRGIIQRVDDYLSMGVHYVWLLDPSQRRAYAATVQTGLYQVMDDVLRSSDPIIELPLAEIFT